MNIRHLTELALIRSIPDLTIIEMIPSRKKSLFNRLQKEVDKDLRKFERATQKETDQMIGIIKSMLEHSFHSVLRSSKDQTSNSIPK